MWVFGSILLMCSQTLLIACHTINSPKGIENGPSTNTDNTFIDSFTTKDHYSTKLVIHEPSDHDASANSDK
jgi:hypothetical protein